MNHDSRAYLHDVCEACRQILEFTRGFTRELYADDELIKAAVERKFVIIGEALARLRREDPELLEHISGHYRIIGFRNVLVHGYDIIDDSTVWSAVIDSVPELLRETETLLNKTPPVA
jgi:uncharacterized protein with HEPN domain